MGYSRFEIAYIVRWTNKELQRRIDAKSENGTYLTPFGEVISNAKLAKLCAREQKRRQNVGLYIEEKGEWDNLKPTDSDKPTSIDEIARRRS
jgi:hypothetical protein